MKLLFDQNISYKIVEPLSKLFPYSKHVAQLNLDRAKDRDIWDAAKKQGFILVTQDSDFFEMSLLHGFPPKVLWIRTGNTRSKNIQRILTAFFKQIRLFYNNSETGCLEIFDQS